MESNFFKDELQEIRNNYKSDPLQELELGRPVWLTDKDPMSEIYKIKSQLLQRGDITYACIVQANVNLYKSMPPLDYPAHIVYSKDLYISENPGLLYDIAWKLYNYKGMQESEIPYEWREIARVIRDEYDRSDFAFSLNIDGKTIEFYMIPTMIFRYFLPTAKLCGKMLPVFTIPESKQVLVVPSKYWTEKYKEEWVNEII